MVRTRFYGSSGPILTLRFPTAWIEELSLLTTIRKPSFPLYFFLHPARLSRLYYLPVDQSIPFNSRLDLLHIN